MVENLCKEARICYLDKVENEKAHLNYIYKRIFVNFNGFMYFLSFFLNIDLGVIVLGALGECICNQSFCFD